MHNPCVRLCNARPGLENFSQTLEKMPFCMHRIAAVRVRRTIGPWAAPLLDGAPCASCG
jgi:hypothetical protein